MGPPKKSYSKQSLQVTALHCHTFSQNCKESCESLSYNWRCIWAKLGYEIHDRPLLCLVFDVAGNQKKCWWQKQNSTNLWNCCFTKRPQNRFSAFLYSVSHVQYSVLPNDIHLLAIRMIKTELELQYVAFNLPTFYAYPGSHFPFNLSFISFYACDFSVCIWTFIYMKERWEPNNKIAQRQYPSLKGDRNGRFPFEVTFNASVWMCAWGCVVCAYCSSVHRCLNTRLNVSDRKFRLPVFVCVLCMCEVHAVPVQPHVGGNSSANS